MAGLLVLLYLGDNFSAKCPFIQFALSQKIRRISTGFSFFRHKQNSRSIGMPGLVRQDFYAVGRGQRRTWQRRTSKSRRWARRPVFSSKVASQMGSRTARRRSSLRPSQLTSAAPILAQAAPCLVATPSQLVALITFRRRRPQGPPPQAFSSSARGATEASKSSSYL